MPAVRILDNVQLEANTYVIKIKEVDAGTGRIWPGQHMVMDPTGAQVNLPGLHTTEPTFGLPATWVDVAQKEEATLKGYTVVDAATVFSTHLTELLKANMAELLSYARGAEAHQGTAEGAERAGQGHRAEPDHRVGRPARAAAPACRAHLDPRSLVDPGRRGRRDFLHPQSGDDRRARPGAPGAPDLRPAHHARRLPAADRAVRQVGAELRGIDRRHGEERSLAMQPSRLSEFITLVRERFEDAAREGEAPVLVTSPAIRPFVRGIVERFRSQTSVLSQSEIHPRVRLKTVGAI